MYDSTDDLVTRSKIVFLADAYEKRYLSLPHYLFSLSQNNLAAWQRYLHILNGDNVLWQFNINTLI